MYNVPNLMAVYLVPLNSQSVPTFFFTVLQINRKLNVVKLFLPFVVKHKEAKVPHLQ